jgi:phage baseplate assembly protein W
MPDTRFVRGTERRGIAFPIDKGPEGYWNRKNAQALRRTSIINILGTVPGERVGRPTFGSRLKFLVFEPNDNILMQQIRQETAEAIARWDPYVKVLGVATEARDNTVTIFIDYLDTADEKQLVRRLVYSVPKM